MDLALTINGWIDEEVIFAQQLGARHVFTQVNSRQTTSSGKDAQSLASLANRIEKAGLALAGLHVAGAPAGKGRQESMIAWVSHLLEEAGAARIGMLSLSAALFPKRQSTGDPITILLSPLCEAAARVGVKLAIPVVLLTKGHPGKWAQFDPVTLEKLLQNMPPSAGLDASPSLLLDWLQKSTPGSNSRQLILDRLCLVSFEIERRPESQIAGNLNDAGFDELLSVCWRLRQAGYSGLIRLGQPSKWKGDTHEGHHARAFTTGYLRAVLQAFQIVDNFI